MRHGFLLPLLLSACAPTPQAAPDERLAISVESVLSEQITDRILTSAVLEAATWQPLYFEQSGVVARIAVTEGDAVRSGQLLASLDVEYQSNQVAIAENQLQTARLDLAQAEHKRAGAETMAKAGGYSPEKVYEREQTVLEAEASVRQAELNLKSQQIKLRQMQLYAPFKGQISALNLRVGDQVMGSVSDPDKDNNQVPPLIVLQQGAFTLRTSLPEGQALHVEEGSAADVGLMEDPSTVLPGVVSWVAPSVDRDSRTVAIRVDVTLPEGSDLGRKVRDGSAVKVAFQAAGDVQTVTLSEDALLYHQDRAFVFVVQGGAVARTPVEQGVVRDGRVQILSGVQVGQQVASSHLYLLQDGQKIAVAP